MANNKTIEVKLGSDGVMQYDVYSTANTPITKRYADTFDNASGDVNSDRSVRYIHSQINSSDNSWGTSILMGAIFGTISALVYYYGLKKNND